MPSTKNFIFWLVTLLLVSAITLPRLVQQGMFMDGQLYANISYNLSRGVGSFWHPSWKPTFHLFFDQQPPLTFGIEALWFRAFGSSRYVERAYSFVCMLLQIGFVHLIWRCIVQDEKLKQMSWLPVVFWFMIPVSSYAFTNNLEENTMGIFVLAGIWVAMESLRFTGRWKWFLLLLFPCLVAAAFLCKGFPGLYPLSIFFWLMIFQEKYTWQSAFSYTTLAALVLLIIGGLLFWYPPSRDGLQQYLNNRVLHSITSESNVGSRFYLWRRLLEELVVVVVVCLLLYYSAVRCKHTFKFNKRYLAVFVALGLCGTLPLIITREQRGFYMCTALPCFAIAAALFTVEYINYLLAKLSPNFLNRLKWSSILAWPLLGISLFYFNNQYRYNEKALKDIAKMGAIIPVNCSIGAPVEEFADWSTAEYFARYHLVNVDATAAGWLNYTYLYLPKSLVVNYQDSLHDFSKIDLPTEQFDLYKRTNSARQP